MQYETFKEHILEQIHAHFQGTRKVSIQKIIKNNGLKLDGLIILEQGLNIAPTLYLNYYFQKYENGTCFSEIIEEILCDYERNRPRESINVSFFTEFSNVKYRIVYKLINYDKNAELLERIPHVPFLDLAIVFYCLAHSDGTGNATILIHNHHMERWGVSITELMKWACKNTPLLLPCELRSVKSMFPDSSKLDTTNLFPMFIMTNYSRLNGATTMIYKELLKEIAMEMESDLYILPSSVHEVLLLPAKDKKALSELSELVKQVNALEVSAEEILSDHAYYYSRDDNCVSM